MTIVQHEREKTAREQVLLYIYGIARMEMAIKSCNKTNGRTMQVGDMLVVVTSERWRGPEDKAYQGRDTVHDGRRPAEPERDNRLDSALFDGLSNMAGSSLGGSSSTMIRQASVRRGNDPIGVRGPPGDELPSEVSDEGKSSLEES